MEKKERLIDVGMFYYAKDRAFSKQLLPNKQVSGVVGYVDETGQHGLIVTLHQKYQTWADPSLEYSTPVPSVFYLGIGGWIQTRAFLQYLKRAENRKRYLKHASLVSKQITLHYCLQYNRDGIRTREAFVPSAEEMRLIKENMDKINASLFLIDGADLLHDARYWTSRGDDCDSSVKRYVLPVVMF